MKRLVLVSILTIGAAFLFFGASNSDTAGAAPAGNCGVEFYLPQYGAFWDFYYACEEQAECLYFAEDVADLLVCNNEYLYDALQFCSGTPAQSSQFGVRTEASSLNPFTKALCRQLAYAYYYKYRLASLVHRFTEETTTCTGLTQVVC